MSDKTLLLKLSVNSVKPKVRVDERKNMFYFLFSWN